ncbi:ABC transporter permease subunit [Streptomyces sp. NPDC088097]|uniref:ABC transporter permease n=1 Tax=Streptomyces sp. NPDC088097 TaxID=3365823 RepID=UPI0037F19A32
MSATDTPALPLTEPGRPAAEATADATADAAVRDPARAPAPAGEGEVPRPDGARSGREGPAAEPAATDRPATDRPATGRPAPGRPATDQPGTEPAARAVGKAPVAVLRPARAVGRWLSSALLRSAAIIVLLLIWEAAPRLGLVDATFLPPFSEVARAWWELLGDGQLGEHTRASLTRSFGGFAIAVAVAVPLGLLIGWYRPVAAFLGPLLELFRNTAALALLPVFVLLLGIGETSKVSIVVYACVWPILLNTISAVGNADPTLVRLARSMDLSTPKLFQKVILPSAVPAVFTGIRLAGAVSILVLVAAEMIGAKAGLGYLINASQFNFAIPQMYAGIVTISVIGVAFNQVLVAIERRLSLWRVPTS